MEDSKSVALGIVGIGIKGKIHARNVFEGKIPGLKLTGLSDQDASKQAELARLFPEPFL